MFFQRESSRIKISCEKELMYIAKQEERLKKAVLRKTADGPSVFVEKKNWNRKFRLSYMKTCVPHLARHFPSYLSRAREL